MKNFDESDTKTQTERSYSGECLAMCDMKEIIVKNIYKKQKKISKNCDNKSPSYTLKEFCTWIFSQPSFYELYDMWVASGLKPKFIPHCHKIDNSKPYTINNIMLAKIENFDNEKSKPILRYAIDGVFIDKFDSCAQAVRVLGIDTGISKCCKGKKKSAGGYVWRYE